MNEVITRSSCDSCKTIVERPGGELGCPPVGWFDFRLVLRLPGSGWTNNKYLDMTLCPDCAKQVAGVIGKWFVFELEAVGGEEC